MNTKTQKPFAWYVMAGCMIFLSIMALPVGFTMITQPASMPIGMPMEWLNTTPFKDYFIPGLILFTVIGLFPIVILYGLVRRPDWRWLKGLETRLHAHWAWIASVVYGLAVMIWIMVQVYWMGLSHPLQPAVWVLGFVILLIALLPSMRRYYRFDAAFATKRVNEVFSC
jgi:hypothetical protein